MWRAWTERVLRFLREEEGPTAVEYAVMLALIIVVCFTVISTIGSRSNEHFENIALKTAFQGS
jgi:pilus assembly protein Flp/PilA